MSEGTTFQKKVWGEIDKIPHGEITTYSQIAKNIGKPKAARAVANACGAVSYTHLTLPTIYSV